MKNFLTNKSIFHVLAVVIINVVLTDTSVSTALKMALAVLPFFVLVYLYVLRDKQHFYKILLVYTFAFPFSPRDLEAFREGIDVDFVSYVNLNVGFLSISLFSLIVFTFFEVVKLNLIRKFVTSFTLVFSIIVVYSLILSLIYGFYANFFISDLKPFILFFFGYFFGLCVWKRFGNQWSEYFVWVFTFLLYIYTLKTSYYILHDFIFGNTVYNFETQPYLFIPVLFMAFFTMKDVGFKTRSLIILMSFISSFSISRGYMIMILVLSMILPFFYTSSKNRLKVFASYFVFFALSVLFMIFSPIILSEKAYVFLQYKLQFFSSEAFSGDRNFDRSTVIRIYEFKNIWNDLMSNPLFLAFGKGVGSYFDFRTYTLPVSLDTDAFSFDQIALNKFFRAHTFFNVALLKGGVMLLFLYSYKSIKLFLYSSKLLKSRKGGKNINNFLVFSGIFSLLYLFFFWIPEYLFLSGLVFSYFNKYKKSEAI